MCTPDSHLAAQERDLHQLYLNLFPACKVPKVKFPQQWPQHHTSFMLLYNVINGVMHEQTRTCCIAAALVGMQEAGHVLLKAHLQGVSSYLVGEPYASSLLLKVNYDTIVMLLDVVHC